MSKKACVDMFSVNPKCIALGELYGEVDENTMEWTDGLLASAIRIFAKQSSVTYRETASGTTTPDVPSRSNSRMSKASVEPDLESLGWYRS